MRERCTPPLEGAFRKPRAATALPTRALRRCKAAEETSYRNPSLRRDAACGQRHDPTAACGDGWSSDGSCCAGRDVRSQGPPRSPRAAARGVAVRFPCSRGHLEHPCSSSNLRPRGWMLPASSWNDQGPRFPAAPRRATLPREPGCFPPYGIPTSERSLPPRGTGQPHDAAALLFDRGSIATEAVSAFFVLQIGRAHV